MTLGESIFRRLAVTPEPPYFAVIFTSVRNGSDSESYSEMADCLERMVKNQPGYLGMESVRGTDGVGITVSYWNSVEAIEQWRNVPIHREAQQSGRAAWYDGYHLRICRVERDSFLMK